MSLVFLSYRRLDSKNETREVYGILHDYFGPSAVFVDESSINGGDRWMSRIRKAIGDAEIIVVIIGRKWNKGNLAKDDDVVRFEVGAALKAGKMIIPLLLNDAKMPVREKLPCELHELVSFQGLRIGVRRNKISTEDTCELVQVIRASATPSGTLVLKRKNQIAGALGDFRVFIDGQQIDTLRPGDVRVHRDVPGEHEIFGTCTTFVRFRQAKTKTIRFKLAYKGTNIFVIWYDYLVFDPLITQDNSMIKIGAE